MWPQAPDRRLIRSTWQVQKYDSTNRGKNNTKQEECGHDSESLKNQYTQTTKKSKLNVLLHDAMCGNATKATHVGPLSCNRVGPILKDLLFVGILKRASE